MTINIAISGFGRIGRFVLRALYESKRTDIKVVAIIAVEVIFKAMHTL